MGPNRNRQKAGKLAREEGEKFEEHFRKICELQGVGIVRIPNGSRIMKGPHGLIAMPAPSPFDWIVVYQGLAVFLDTKSLAHSALRFSDLKAHQVWNLSKMESHGHLSGYVVHFRALGVLVFFNASQLSALKREASLKPEEGILLGNFFTPNVKFLFEVL